MSGSAAQRRGARNPQQQIPADRHDRAASLLADEPVAAGGEDTGPGPYDFVLAGLGACTSMTMRMYADRKSLPLERVTVTLKHSKIHAEDCAECETKRRHARPDRARDRAWKARLTPISASG